MMRSLILALLATFLFTSAASAGVCLLPNDGCGGSGGNDYGMVGNYATWETVEHLSQLKEFQGLDPTIQWTPYYFDAYLGDDSNPCTVTAPCLTLSKAKSLFTFGARIIWNAEHPYISKLIFPHRS